MEDTKSQELRLYIDPGFVHIRYCFGLLHPGLRDSFAKLKASADNPLQDLNINHLIISPRPPNPRFRLGRARARPDFLERDGSKQVGQRSYLSLSEDCAK